MTDDFETNEHALAQTGRPGDGDDEQQATRGRTLGDDGTTLTGESETSAGTTDRDLAEPAGE